MKMKLLKQCIKQNRKRKVNSNVKFNNDFYQSQMFSIIDEGENGIKQKLN
jgi:hypothetical protein